MEVSEQIIQVLDALCDKFGLVVDWTSENVIPYLSTLCTKLVSYEIWTSVAWMAIVVVLAGIGVVIWSIKSVKEGRRDFSEGSIVISTVVVFCWVVGLAVIIFQIMDIIKCVTFPEMYIFEYVQRIVNASH